MVRPVAELSLRDAEREQDPATEAARALVPASEQKVGQLGRDVGIHPRTFKKRAEVGFDCGIYESVLIATFGGVRVPLNKGMHAKLHPCFLLLCAVPVFIVQVSTLFALMTDMQVNAPISHGDTSVDEARLRVKILMIILLYVMNFKKLLTTVQLFVFVANPLTWVEVDHPLREQWLFDKLNCKQFAFFFSTSVLMPFPFIALAMRFVVEYLIAIQSVSVILASEGVQNAVFNSLAITFISELNGQYWHVCAAVFHLSPLEQFEFKLVGEDQVYKRDEAGVETLSKEAAEMVNAPRFYDWLLRWTHFGRCGKRSVTWCGKHSVLSRGHGARRVETMLSFLFLLILYFRQLFIVLFAVKSNVLPAARDICTVWRMTEGHSQRFAWLALLVDLLEKILLIDVKGRIKELAEGNLEEQCFSGQLYFRMTATDERRMVREDSHTIAMFFGTVFLVIVLPQLAYSVFGVVFQKNADDRDIDEEQEVEIEILRKTVQDLQLDVNELKRPLRR